MRKTLLDLHEILGDAILSQILNTKPATLRQILANPNSADLSVEDRVNFISAVVRNLKEIHNHYGIRRWLQRECAELKGRRPTDLLSGDWWPRDPEVLEILMLSSAGND